MSKYDYRMTLGELTNTLQNWCHDAIPQNQVKILKQKISDAEKELHKYLIDHPELEAEEK